VDVARRRRRVIAMAEIVADAQHATFINTFRCDPSHQDEVVAINIEIVDQVASGFPRFISAAVHRSTDGTRVFNYLQWESAEDLAVVQRSPEFLAIARRFAGLIEFEPHQCEVVHVSPQRPRVDVRN
jgi:quinol monooxygenase YgiN